jgi:hypothetical protein
MILVLAQCFVTYLNSVSAHQGLGQQTASFFSLLLWIECLLRTDCDKVSSKPYAILHKVFFFLRNLRGNMYGHEEKLPTQPAA